MSEERRLEENARREKNWKRWGPYLAERQWGTVREDYSAEGEAWTSFPHTQARSRVYRWGEDGLLGITDRRCRLAFALALWNGRDPILKERLFGLANEEGNHGEDVKECYWYLDATPTSSYLRSCYRYPQAAYPYDRLREENARRTRDEPEFEIEDTGVFDGDRFFDVTAEYAKAAPDDIRIRITVENRGPDDAEIHVLPTLWFRNVWAWGRTGEGHGERPELSRGEGSVVRADHPVLGRFRLVPIDEPNRVLFTENETNSERLFGVESRTPFVKDGFHDLVVSGREDAVNAAGTGTKAAAWYRRTVPARGRVSIRLRLSPDSGGGDEDFESVFADRIREADDFYRAVEPGDLDGDERRVYRQAAAGLLHSKQFYHYVVREWLAGDPTEPQPPEGPRRNRDWPHLHNHDVISMPDKWEYPWYAVWDLAFHMLPMARIDPEFAKQQLTLFTREWYMHPNGALPAYEWEFSDANPPVHAWAAWRVYKSGTRDRDFLARIFQKLLLNFTWWVNRKDHHGDHLFSGGFLGLDNIGVFDRSKDLPTGGHLEQADGTAWMAFYCGTMLSMALELAAKDPVYEDMASKFFEHYVAIVDAMNGLGGTGLWDEKDGFYYDRLHVGDEVIPLRIRSMVGLIPLIAAEVLDAATIRPLAGFTKRLDWFLVNRPDLAENISYLDARCGESRRRLLAVPSRDRLARVLSRLFDEEEFLSPHGIRSLSKFHEANPYVFRAAGTEHSVGYVPGESDSWLFGGNSNWRGPIWFPVNYLIVEALERYHYFYGDSLLVEFPTGSGQTVTLKAAAREISRRLVGLVRPDADGRVLYHEYFNAETGQGLGASHQTGWTALVSRLIEKLRSGATL